jgi:hydroxyacylglutathione hydrolase
VPQEIRPGLRLLRAANPSPLTGSGTNTWLVGTDRLAVIDPGPDMPDHLAAILAATSGATIEAILVTHAHRDHCALAPALSRATGAPVLAHAPPLWPGPAPAASEGIDRSFRPDLPLACGAVWTGGAGTLRALHTPGHMPDHLCILWDGLAFSGDHVMGWASTVISPPEGDMGAYMASLDRLAAEAPDRLMPGHGEPVADPASRIAALAAHRRAREAEILDALAEGAASITALTGRLYARTDPALHPAARRNVLAHLLDLERRNRVRADPEPGPDALWHSR